ncbi:AfuA, partial [Pasteurella multocida subsp. multocida str. Anand1_buffalo]
MKKTHLALFGMLVAGLTATNVAKGEGRLVVYCSAQNVVCEKAVQGFAKKYDVKTSFIRNSSGSTLAKIDAEKITRRLTFGMVDLLILTYKRL